MPDTDTRTVEELIASITRRLEYIERLIRIEPEESFPAGPKRA